MCFTDIIIGRITVEIQGSIFAESSAGFVAREESE